MEHLIYDNYAILTDDNDKELKESISERRDIPIEDIIEEMLQDERNDMTEMYFQDKLDDLNFELEGRIIAIADLGLWSGRVSGYKIGGTNLNEVMTIDNHDYIKIYSDGFNIRKESGHHDGANRMLFRMIRENRDIDHFTDMIYNGKTISKSTLNYYTKSIEKNIRSIYGW